MSPAIPYNGTAVVSNSWDGPDSEARHKTPVSSSVANVL